MHQQLDAKIQELPGTHQGVKDTLIQFLKQYGPEGLGLGIKLLEAAHPEWTAKLEAIKAALEAFGAVAPVQ